MRLLSREMIAPNAIFDEMRNKGDARPGGHLTSIVSELTGLRADDPADWRSVYHIMAPFASCC